ncbi:MAG: hypothetical protein ACLFNL_10340 [Bacteroidales bacterium]
MSYEEYIIPVIISNILALILMLLSFHFTNFMRFLWGTIFMIAGIINLITVYNNPGIYISGFGPSAIELYKEIIYGPFSENPGLYITLIAFTQIIIGALMWLKYLWYNIGILGGVIFLLAIAPLGAASAFPSSIIMAIGLFRLLFKWRRKTIFGT